MQRVGETSVAKKALKLVAQPTAAQEKFVQGCEVIRQAPMEGEPAFMARQLVQCTLPHSNPGDNKPAWTRRNGNVSLTLQPGWDDLNDKSIGYPYGTMPRLLLFWIIREALRTKNRRLELGASLSGFMRQLGITPASAGAGKRSAARSLKEQARRLFNCRISFRMSESQEHREGERWMHMDVAPKGEFWWDPKQPDQGTLWGSHIIIGELFYQAILDSPVPVDMRALQQLKSSALCLDLYSWCVWKAFEARRTGRKQSIAWKTLMKQLGCDYEGKNPEKDFKKKAAVALKKVKLAYPMLRTSTETGGFSVLPTSGLAIASRTSRRKLENITTT